VKESNQSEESTVLGFDIERDFCKLEFFRNPKEEGGEDWRGFSVFFFFQFDFGAFGVFGVKSETGGFRAL
jgi:hypothetical protein